LLALTAACSSSAEREAVSEGEIGAEADETVSPTDLPESERPGQLLNRVQLVVGDVPITQADIAEMEDVLRRSGEVRGSVERAALDRLIERAIVEIEADRESIIVSEERIQNEIDRRMKFSGIENQENFRDRVQRESGLSWDAWVDNLRYEIMKRQLIQIKLTVPQPDEDEIERFYRQNRNRVGVEVRYREIILTPRNSTIQEEQRIARIASDVYSQASRNPAKFSEIARTLQENDSPLRPAGGLQDYVNIQELAEKDPRLAGVLFNTQAGSVSQPFRDSRGRYMVVYVERKRPVPLNKIRGIIMDRIYIEKQEEVFEEWIARRRREIAITRVD